MKTLNEFLEEGMVSTLKKGVKRHKDAVEKKKIKDRKAVPYAALAAQHEPEGEVLDELKTPTLLSYTQKAANKLAFHGDGSKKAQNRATGVKRAASRLTRRAQDPKGEFGWNKNVKQEEVVHEGDYHSGQGEKIQKRTKKWMDKKGQSGAPGLDAMKAREAEHKARRGVKGVKEEKEKGLDGKACWKGYRLAGTKKKGGKTVDNCVKEEDKAFNYVVSKLKKKYGDGVLTKGDKIKPPTAAQKKANAAHRAKVDKENAAERAKDPSQGRYPKG